MIEYFLKFGSDRIKEKKFNVDRMWILKRYQYWISLPMEKTKKWMQNNSQNIKLIKN